jgi:uncharacterized repeat protein (TIGR02059 family)/LPXTG-motif cell wall-anchored protein
MTAFINRFLVCGALLVGGIVVVGADVASAAAPVAPTASAIVVSSNGTQVAMTFTQDLHPNIAPKEQFAVTIGTYAAPTTRTVNIPVTAVTRTSARVITLTLDGVIDQNKPPQVAYTAPAVVAGTSNFALQNNSLGEDVASFSVVSTGTQSLIPGLLSSTPPVLQATGNTIQLTYSLALAASPALPAPSAFSVVVDGGTANPVLSVTRPTTTTILLSLRDGVESGKQVTVSYAAPTVNNAIATNAAIQGTAGNDAQSFTSLAVTNTASLVPKLLSAAVLAAGNVVELTYNSTLGTVTAPGSAFQVLADGNRVNIISSTISGTKAVLTLQTNVSSNQVISVSYSAATFDIATTNSAIQLTSTGQDAASFSNFAVTTNSSGAPYITATSTSTDGRFIYLDYNEALFNNSSLQTRFIVTVNGVARNLSNAYYLSATRYQLNLTTTADYVSRGAVVALTYTPNAWDATTTTASVQDSSGVDAPRFIDLPITNNSTLDTVPPQPLRAVVSSDGLSITLTYDEPLNLSIFSGTNGTSLAARFGLTVGGVARTFSGSVVPTSGNGQSANQIIFNLSTANRITFGDVVKLAYTRGADNTGSVRDPNSNFALSFSNFDVANDNKTRATIRGQVFNDFNSNGLMNSAVNSGEAQDVGVSGITVRAFDTAGVNVGEATTGADGTYRLNVASASNDVRVEFALPTTGPLAELRPSFANSTATGVTGATTVQFVTLNPLADTTGINLGVNVPGEYCQSNPHLVISRLCAGTGAGVEASPSIFVTRYDGGPHDTTTALPDGFSSWPANTAATKAQTGSILGMAYDPVRRRVFNSAYVRRHAELYQIGGVPKPAALFVTAPDGTKTGDDTGGSTQFFVDLETMMAGDQFSDGTLPTNAARRLDCIAYITANVGTCTTTTGWDVTVGNLVGMVGIGDIETDGNKLWVVSLYDKNLYEIDLPSDGTVPTTMRSLGMASTGLTCTNGNPRPFSVHRWRGSLYSGFVCDGQSDFNAATPFAAKDTNLSFTIRRFDLTTRLWSTFFGPHPLNSTGFVTKGWAANNWADKENTISRRWNPWTTFHPNASVDGQTRVAAEARFHNRPVPMLTEIEFDRDGSMILGFRDRTGDITSSNDSWSMSGGRVTYPSTASGDIYRVCRVGTGYSAADYKFEGADPTCVRKSDAGNGNEYYNADFWGITSIAHGEISAGMLEQVPGFPDVIMTAYDPFSGTSNGVTTFYTGGVRYIRNSTGAAAGYPNSGSGVMVYSSADPLDVGPMYNVAGAKIGGFMKVNGMSDVEALCDQAPVQIGNRIWDDIDKDGIQDPGEASLAGVTVRLYGANGVLAGTAITNQSGQYFFSSNLTESASGNGDHNGGGLSTATAFSIRLDNPADFAAGGPLFSYVLAPATQTSTTNSQSTAVDNNATLVSSYPQVPIAQLSAGANDHTFDVGLYYVPLVPKVSVGNFVWADTDRDGVQDVGEPGIAGVTLTITQADGSAVTDIFGAPVTTTTTNSSGAYLFANLPVGSYKVSVTDPAGYIATTALAGSDRAVDSSTGNATSANLTVDGASDTTLDFGYVLPKVSVGSFVWIDTDRDGVQDLSEAGISGVTLSITKADGTAVTDVFGNAVTTTTTDANGSYVFANLPVGSYKVTATTPSGYIATTALAGSDRGIDSSTGNETSTNLTTDGASDMTLDFGFVAPKVSVGNFVWSDTDRDGVQDAGEPGIAGVIMSITKADGTAVTNVFGASITNTTTDANGAYVFADLPVGSYKVTATTPSGYIATTALAGSDRALDSSTGNATSANLTTDGASDATLDFGFVTPRVSVGNFVWVDTDRDGVQDAGEPGIAGVTLSITKADGTAVTNVLGAAVTTTTTDSNGAYVFANLPVGSYKVSVTDPAGYIATTALAGSDRSVDSSTGNATSTNLTVDGTSDMTLDFGYVLPKVSVGNFVWYDTDNDGIQENGEPGIAGVTLSITKADGTAVTNVFGASVTTTTTDSNGAYVFENLPVGSYKVTVVTPSGYIATTALAGSDSANDSSTGNATSTNLTTDGASDTTLDFGFVSPKVSVGSFVWADTNRDGVQDSGELGIPGVTLTITKADGSTARDVSGNVVTSTTTDANGAYVFANLPVGSYKVTVVTPSGYIATTALAGSDRAVDSSTGNATSTNLTTDGTSDTSLDFGFVLPKVSVGNFVWADTDRDGVQDGNEPGIAGVTMSITKADGSAVTDVFGAAVTSTTTDANGAYVFANLPVGSYKVTATTPSGYIATTALAGSDRAADSSTGNATSANLTTDGASDTTLDFGFVLPKVSVGNFVWADTDRDGVQDAGELGIAGVTLSITTADDSPVLDVFGNAVTTTTTGANGAYVFENLPVGSYKVSVVTPSGYVATQTGQGTSTTDSSTGSATSTTLTSDGASDTSLDFGFVLSKVSVGNFVWFDTDDDGIQESGEPGIAGATLTITKADGSAVTDVFGNAVTTTTTDANGAYLFENLPLGSYKVSVTTPTGMRSAPAARGTDAGLDSSTGNATSANLITNGDSDTTLDFGFWAPPAVVGSRVWNDLNANGIQDPGEPGIAGVTLSITKADGSPALDINGAQVGNTTTDADGNYLFKDLPFGSAYKVTVESTLSNYVTSPAGVGTDRAVDSSTGNATSAVMGINQLTDFTLDFGYVAKVSVGNLVWTDTNRDGIKDSGEPGMPGVTLSITKADGTAVTNVFGAAVTTTTTDSSGAYVFADLPPGSYKVSVTDPAGYIATTALAGSDRAVDSSTGNATSTNLIVGGSSDTTLDFGFVLPKVSVGNFVWADTDRDGVQDVGELGIAGVSMSITKADGSAVTDVFGAAINTTTTDANGAYVFANLPVGSYKVTAATPSGYIATTALAGSDRAVDSSTGNATSTNLTTDGASDTTLDFGFVRPRVSVGSFVWADADRDGVQDAGELGIAGVTLSITKADGSAVTDVFGAAINTTTTDANGAYVFENLPVGSYKVTVTDPAGYVATTALAGSDREVDSSTGNATSTNLTTDGASDMTLDFGFVPPKVSVGNFVWADTNRDGVQDGNELGIAGVTLTITKADGSAVTNVFGASVTTTTTDANGAYLFENLPVGSYKVTATTPSGYISTNALAGSDRGVDSSTGNATSTNLTTDGASDLTLDFGFVLPRVSVGSFVWADTDRDGVQDAGELGIAGVTMSITKADGSAVIDVFGAAVTTTTTDSSGAYVFANLPVGSYKVTATTPSGYIATTALAGTDRGVDSSTGNATSANLTTDGASDTTLDFGFVLPKVSVGNFVWADTDRDGVQDAGELGIAAVTLSITNADNSAVTDVFGAAVTTTTTDANGAYVFANLPVGSYKVTATTPSGYIATTALAGSDRAVDSSTGNETSANLTTDGASDLTLDFGFVLPRVSVGSFVWADTNRDGIQDSGELGIPGVTLTITKADGSAVTDVFGAAVTTTTTDANGAYVFANLPVGSYKVSAVDPVGYLPTQDGQGTSATDSSTGSATSTNLTTDGASDVTLDFGFVTPKVSVGNFVWADTNRDGTQDAGEPGIAGVTLTITKADGSAVTNVFGASVTTTITDANGAYVFENLPVGSYKVTVTNPTGYLPTEAGAGDNASDSSTTSATSVALVNNGDSDQTLDFGFVVPKVSVGNFVWFDTDNDGLQDAGEPGISGVTLTITKADGSAVTDVLGSPVTTTTTDANGAYLFANLPVGSYKVSVTDPAGYVATTALVGSDPAVDSATGDATSANLTINGASDMTLDFGFVSPRVSVGNLVWADTDRDGIKDAGEPGIPGVTLSITKADGSAVTNVFGVAVKTTTTDANGIYTFVDLPVGSFKVSVTDPDGYVATTALVGSDPAVDSATGDATSANLTVNGASDMTLDFGFVSPRVSVGNYVWRDTDRDGVQEVGEPGIAGVTLTITKADGSPVTNVFGNAVTTTTTDANGAYVFDDLPAGSYKVTVADPAGLMPTVPNMGDTTTDSSTGFATSAVLSFEGDSDFTLRFGFVDPKVSVGNLVWEDANRDGRQNNGETGIAGVTLSITKANGDPVTDVFGAAVTTTTTDANGLYLFDNLPVGAYKVTVTDPVGYSVTTPLVGSDRSVDSSTGNATSTNLTTNGASDMTLDFGFVLPKVSVGNFVWFDTDNDGIQDVGEPGIAGVTLTLSKTDNTAVTDIFGVTVSPATTDANGGYLFEDLPPGTYKVTVTSPTGYNAAIALAGSDRAVDSSTGNATSTNLAVDGASDMTLDFGFTVPKVSVGDFVWRDTDRDGVQDAGEPGIAGVTMTITKADGSAVTNVFGAAVTTTTTDANGAYVFADLPAGSYKVTATTPSGYIATTALAGSDRAVDSSTGNATSTNLTVDGSSDMTLDFGFVLPKVSVGNFVWVDTDRDGVQDVGEPGISGATLSITKADGSAVTNVFGAAVTTTTTDINGAYVFADLPVGSYKVTATNPAGYVPTAALAGSDRALDSSTGNATSANLTVDGSSDMTLDFGFVSPYVSVGDLVWFDTDRDGVQDAGEPGIAGVTLSITKADGTAVTNVFGRPVTTTTTNSTGLYLFDNLPFGSYKVTVTNPTGYTATTALAGSDRAVDSSTGNATSTNLTTNGASDLTLDFGFTAPRVSVGNLVWFDTNHDGVQDVNESGIAGAVLTLTKMDGTAVTNVFGNTVGPITTDTTGRFLFDNLPIGQYKVSITSPAGFTSTLVGSGTSGTDSAAGTDTSVNMTNDGDSDMTLDFGFYPIAVSVGDYVWFDLNADGIQDATEAGIAGVTLSITKTDGSPVTDVVGNAVTTTATNAAGKYLFSNLPPGSYRVTVVPPSGFIPTTTGSGTGATDSSTGSADSVVLPNNLDADLTLDFGFRLPRVSIGNYVWFDKDKDGIQDRNEKGIAGVSLSVVKADGSPVVDVFGNSVTTTTTDTVGLYSFRNLPIGSYRVTVVPPAGYCATLSGVGSVETDSSELTATSVNLTIDGASDMTLDFGFCVEKKVAGQSNPITPPRKAVTPPETEFVFAASVLGKPSKGAEFIPSKTVIAGRDSEEWEKNVKVSGGVWKVIDGKVTFKPNPGFKGTVSVKYQVTDTSGKVAESTLTVTVTEQKELPATGSSPQPLLLVAFSLLLLGVFLIIMRRRLL